MQHRDEVAIADGGSKPLKHTPEVITGIFDEELDCLLGELPANAPPDAATKLRHARRLSESMIVNGEFDPV